MVEDHPQLEGHEPYHHAEFEQNAVPGAPVEKVGQDLKLGVNAILFSPIGQPSREPGYFALCCNAESRPNYGVWFKFPYKPVIRLAQIRLGQVYTQSLE